jgi:hypothetical protein
MTHAEMKKFIRNHFEEFVNRKNLGIGEVNFAPESGIVIWRIANRQILERWAYLESPHPARS